MRKRILLVISVLLLLGMGIAAVAYQRTGNGTETSAAYCCCSGDSCPMKAKAADTGDAASCCGDNCCCKGGNADSCPMKNMHHENKPTSAPVNHAEGDKKAGCCSCCKKDNA